MNVSQFTACPNELNLITSSFDNPILYEPASVKMNHPCNSLKIITAFTDCERISTHMIKLEEGMKKKELIGDIRVEILVGMTKTSLSQKKHKDIVRLVKTINESRSMPRLVCRYICSGSEVHSKIYLWSYLEKKANRIFIPWKAYCGSLNYTMNAFYKRRESVSLCDSREAYCYYEDLLKDSMDCTEPSITSQLKKVANKNAGDTDELDDSESLYKLYDKQHPIGILNVSLLKADGSDTGYGSGVNWGIRPNGTKRDMNQAYIPYNRKDKKKGFFPDRENPDDDNCPMFRVITKDFGSFHMRMAQDGNKGLHSVESNAILGRWIRQKIGAVSGGYVTKKMLEQYGRTYVTFRKYADGVYLLDF